MKDTSIRRERSPRMMFTMRLSDHRLMRAVCQRLGIKRADWFRRIIDFARRGGCEEAKE